MKSSHEVRAGRMFISGESQSMSMGACSACHQPFLLFL